ncbi:hypothetical protein NL676_033202 [Syzygium grande]|nr:hypothetical protein NL676_033202 [Syzygium grande]
MYPKPQDLPPQKSQRTQINPAGGRVGDGALGLDVGEAEAGMDLTMKGVGVWLASGGPGEEAEGWRRRAVQPGGEARWGCGDGGWRHGGRASLCLPPGEGGLGACHLESTAGVRGHVAGREGEVSRW